MHHPAAAGQQVCLHDAVSRNKEYGLPALGFWKAGDRAGNVINLTLAKRGEIC